MGALGNTPRRTTVVTLEAAKSFAFGVSFRYAANDAALDLTGATLRLVLAEPPHLGGAVVLTETALLVDAENGEARFELQAADLALPEAEYPYTITLVTADGYSSPVDKGVFDIRANPDTTASNVYTGINPAQALTVTLGTSNQISVQVTSLQGPRGLQGPQGEPGLDGADGINGTNGADGADGINGVDGIDGPSAYAVALANGFVGTESQWLASLVGPEGPEGPQGLPGSGSVDSVNGDPGPDVVLDAASVGAAPAGHTHAAPSAAAVAFAPAGTIAATTVQAAIEEVAAEAAAAGGTAAGTYRGAWSTGTDNVLQTWDFAAGTFPPFTTNHVWAAIEPYAAHSGTIPSPPAKQVRLMSNDGGIFTSMSLAASALPAGTDKLKWWWAANATTDSRVFFKKDGVTVDTLGDDEAWVNPAGGAADVPWKQSETGTLGTANFSWVFDVGAGAGGQTAGYVARVQAVEVLGITYELNDLVSYQGELYSCAAAGTTQTPGTGTDWVKVLLGTTPTVVASATAYVNNSASGAIVLPAGIVAGDSIFVFSGHAYATNADPAGYFNLGAANGSGMNSTVYYKKAVGTESGTTVTVGYSGAYYGDLVVVVVRGVKQIRDIKLSQAASGSTLSIPAMYAPKENDLYLAFGVSRATTPTVTFNVGTVVATRSDGNTGAAVYKFAAAGGPQDVTMTSAGGTAGLAAVGVALAG